jgi:hypothetical protein
MWRGEQFLFSNLVLEILWSHDIYTFPLKFEHTLYVNWAAIAHGDEEKKEIQDNIMDLFYIQ